MQVQDISISFNCSSASASASATYPALLAYSNCDLILMSTIDPCIHALCIMYLHLEYVTDHLQPRLLILGER